MARKRTLIFPLFEESHRLMDNFSDAQFGKVIRYALERYYGSGEQTETDTLTCFAADVLLDQAARYDSFRDQQRSKAQGVKASDAEEAQPDNTGGAGTAQESADTDGNKPKENLCTERSANATEEPHRQPGAANDSQVQPNTPPSPSPSPVPSPSPKDNSLCAEAVNLLNRLSGSSFSPKTKATRRLVSAREREGYGPAEFETVIRHQCGLWGRDEKMRKYLRPETLFGTKFEAYLSDARRVEPPEETGYVLAPLEDPWEAAMRGAHYD